jgi:hypothetical protein
MNFNNLFTTARVLRAIYQTVSTSLLLYYMARRAKQGKRVTRPSRRLDGYQD